ncbi:MAG: PDZ domain-containing protein [Planctomycetia bacterium]|nr:PDZ domain-containing protein [Planctomycetia bacterium]
MDCQDFYGQVVRLEKFRDIADQFIRVRLTRIADVDIHHLEFDFDLTMMIFFLSPDGKIYSRYGGRDSQDADNRQSLAGLRHTMESVLAMHRSKAPQFAERSKENSFYPRDMGIRKKGCVHCHNVKEQQESQLARLGQWNRELVWRFPPPDNVGLILDVDRGNVVKSVSADSPAARVGLQKGDQIRSLHRVPVHSFGDAQFALDCAPAKGSIEVAWERNGKPQRATLELADGWRKTDITWRASQQHRIPSLKLYGDDLSADEKQRLGLKSDQMAFRQKQEVNAHAAQAGFKPGDIIFGVDGAPMNGTMTEFLFFIRRSYLVGDRVQLNVLRDGKRLTIPMTLVP